MASAKTVNKSTAIIGEKVFRVASQSLVKGHVGGCGFGHGRRFHLAHQIWMTTNCTLSEDDHTARQYVRPFHGNTDGNRLVGARNIIRWAHADATTTMDVHGVIDDLAHVLGIITFENCRNDRRFLATVEGAQGQQAPRFHHISHATDVRQRFFDTFEFPN